MEMSLNDIEAKADELAQRLLVAGKSEALLIGIQIEGLRDLAQIKAVGDQRAQWNAGVGLRIQEIAKLEGQREREIAAMEVVAGKIPEPPKPTCGHRWQWFESSDLQRFEICTLPIGHDGQHLNQVTGERAEWDTVPGVSPCPSTFQRSKDEYYVCTLEYQHEGQHRGGGMWWSGPGNGKQEAEPTKPAADRLHELVSYCRMHAEESDDKAGHVQAQSPPWLRYRAVARAYDDAATKLQDILTEGGI